MIVAIDMQLAHGTATGIGEYALGLAGALRALGTRVVELQDARLDPWRFDRRVMWDQVLLPRQARASGADVLHCTSGTMPLRAPMPLVVTVHDVAWLKVQQHTRAYARYYFGAFSLRRYRRAAAILVDSEFSKRELLDVLDVPEERVRAIYPGVAGDYCMLNRASHAEPFVLVPGTVEPRKNLELLIRVLALVPELRVVSVGPFTPYRAQCERIAEELGVGDRVDLRGYVPRGEVLDLYARCCAVAVPSKYEGFGYAAAQALCAGAPLVSSNRASLPEVVGSAAPLLDAADEVAWAECLSNIVRDPAAARERAMRARAGAIERFAWRASAGAAIDAYANAAG